MSMSRTARMMMVSSRGGQRRREDGRFARGDEGNNQYTDRRRDTMDNGMDDGRYRQDMRYQDVWPRENRQERRAMDGVGTVVWDAYIPIYPPMDRSDDQTMRHYPPYGGEYGGNVTDMREYGRRYRPPQDNMGSRREESRGRMEEREPMIGFGESYEEGQGKHLTEEEAKRWVKSMRKEDGSKGERWSLDEIKQYARNFGIEGKEKIVEFFAVINAMYSDYCKVAKQHGVDNVNFYADMAKAFMDDPDAKDGKVKMYYECIAKKG